MVGELNTYDDTATPVLTDYATGVDDPGGTWAVKSWTFANVRTLLQANFTNLVITNATANSASIASTGYSLTGSDATSMVSLAGTWNTTGTPTAIFANITDTASNAASLLMDLQVGGATKFNVTKAGNVSVVSGGQIGTTPGAASGSAFYFANKAIRAYGGNTLFAMMFSNNTTWSGVSLDPGGAFSFGATTASNTEASNDVMLRRDAAGTLALRNSTNAQAFRVYNTYTDSSNYERLALRFSSNVAELGSFAGGTGTLRGLSIGVSGNSIGFVGATPVAQQATTGTTTGFTAGSGTAANDDSTFTGNSGTKAYTVGDIVLALKNYGLLAAS